MEFELDKWQKEVMKVKGNLCLRSGRQVGKSFVIGIKAAEYALENGDKLIMVISKTERQAGLLFSKILYNLSRIDRKQICKGKERPTKHLITLKNGSKIYCLPAGDTGFGIMGFTIDLLIADEAAFIPEEVWNSVIPALAITRGAIWLLSTPFVKKGYYYQCFSDPTFTSFHTSSEDCPRKDEVFLQNRRENLTKAQYAQMYLGEFVDEALRFFSKKLIDARCNQKRREKFIKGRFYLGCDVGRLIDKFTYEIFDKIQRKKLVQVENITTVGIPIPESTRKIIQLNKEYNFRKELIDSGGMGITVCDILRESPSDKRKVVEINNAKRVYNNEDGKKTIIKEEMYNNLKKMMQRGEVDLLDDEAVKKSLASVLMDFNEKGRQKFWGDDTHIVEGIIRAVQGAKNDTLNIMAFC